MKRPCLTTAAFLRQRAEAFSQRIMGNISGYRSGGSFEIFLLSYCLTRKYHGFVSMFATKGCNAFDNNHCG